MEGHHKNNWINDYVGNHVKSMAIEATALIVTLVTNLIIVNVETITSVTIEFIYVFNYSS